ncbi:hypothetical protein ASC98_25420 [Rhizobacter sp. Root1238]|nr:hypothetical protein ASC88_25035 [Rhizobacter sp. Root29]KQW07430.1 hypothetical protein ASC98_25420 [Rhizobacter sp. Root1238]
MWVFSGFVVEIAAQWFYVTAGHIIRDVQTSMDAGSTFAIWRLGDQTASDERTRERFKNIAIPYEFDPRHWFVLRDESLGLDYAVTHLGGLYRMLMEQAGVLPFTRDTWIDYPKAGTRWAIAGVPKETVVYDGTTEVRARFTFVGLSPAEPPTEATNKRDNQFYARLHESSEQIVRDIDGMSGGPIIAVIDSPAGSRYGVIGLQSEWFSRSRVIAACPFSTFARALEPVVKEALRDMASTRD